MPVKDKRILITGATGGLGREVTGYFLAAGAKVIAVYRKPEAFDELKKYLKNPVELTGLSADLSDSDSAAALASRIKEKYGSVDAVCHLAGGFLMKGKIWETPEEDWLKMQELNLHTTFRLAKEVFPLMRKNGGGHFFAIGSRAAVDLPNGLGAYAVSKAALLALIKVLAKEAEEYNISVNAIIPGTIDTPANRKAMPEADFSRWITPEEIAGTLIQLSRNSSVTGSFIELTGR